VQFTSTVWHKPEITHNAVKCETKQKHKNYPSSRYTNGVSYSWGGICTNTENFISTFMYTWHVVADGTHQTST